MNAVKTVFVSSEDAGQRLDRWFRKLFPGVSQGRLQKLLRTGQVRIDGKRAKAGLRLEAGQSVRVPPLGEGAKERTRRGGKKAVRAVTQAEAEALRARVLYKDDQVMVIDKPAGLAVQGGTKTVTHLDAMLDVLRFDAPQRPRLVHRLDKDTSGVLVLARTAQSARNLTAAFRENEIKKLYWAVVTGVPKPAEGRIDASLSKLPGRGGERMVIDAAAGKRAVTDYRVVDKAGRSAAWVSLEPETGRTHQLRVHMALIGAPILGDGKYGAKEAFLTGEGISRKLHLHARAIRLPGPKGGTFDVAAPLPEHMRATFNFFGFEEADHGKDSFFTPL